MRDRNFKQLSQREMKMVFEDLCDSDFSMLRDFMRYAICVKFVRFLNNNISMNMNVYPEMLTVSRAIILLLSPFQTAL